MEKYKEDEFDKIDFPNKEGKCDHVVVRLYELGMHSDYGCILCGCRGYHLRDYKRSKETSEKE